MDIRIVAEEPAAAGAARVARAQATIAEMVAAIGAARPGADVVARVPMVVRDAESAARARLRGRVDVRVGALLFFARSSSL